MQKLEVYPVIGAEGFTRLVAAFYRQVPQDDLLGPMYPAQDLSVAERPNCSFVLSAPDPPRPKGRIPASMEL